VSIARSTLRAAVRALEPPGAFTLPDPPLAWAYAAIDGSDEPPAPRVMTEIATGDRRRSVALEMGVMCWQITTLCKGDRRDADLRLLERLPDLVATLVRR